MASSSLRLLLLLSFTCLLFCSISSLHTPKHYVVYMGGLEDDEADIQNEGDGTDAMESAYLQLLASIIPREEEDRIRVVHHYKHAFKGFSALLTHQEAALLSGHDEIESVFPDPILQPHTTRSWDFLESISGLHSQQSPIYNFHGSTDVIIGVIDTGIWPESPSFNDNDIGEIPSRWKGICMEAPDFSKSNCNRTSFLYSFNLSTQKIDWDQILRITSTRQTVNASAVSRASSARDSVGHGTHTASIAAGSRVPHASYYGLARGTAKGGAPSSRIAVYKACTDDGCAGSTILKAIDDAVKDGVDVISISIGLSSVFQADYLIDPIAIGAFHAERKGIMVICSAGNDGPLPYTVVNTAPWIFTVSASNIDREFRSSVVLGNGKALRGSGIHFSNLTGSERFPLVYGKDVAGAFVSLPEAKGCYPGSLDRKKVAGKIVICRGDDPNLSRKIKKLVVEDAGARGVILIEDEEKSVPFDSGVFAFSEVGTTEGYKILKYMSQTKNPTATILPTTDVPRIRPSPVVAYFSSRGPGVLTENILKPDVMAPGVGILGAMAPVEKETIPVGKKASNFAVKSGTSMACPHVTGAVAYLKSLHPSWTPSIIKSALMTTATLYDNMRRPLTNTSGLSSTPHEIGAGEINPLGAADPGLVFETSPQDYLHFLCFYGYSEKTLKTLTRTNFTCPKNVSTDLISSAVNYPTISIGKLDRGRSHRTAVWRTATNVGSAVNATYVASVEAPEGLVVRVSPMKLVFEEKAKKVSFRVWFYGQKNATKGYNYGSIIWTHHHHSVRLVFSVNIQ